LKHSNIEILIDLSILITSSIKDRI
jgi:hypothetical protein